MAWRILCVALVVGLIVACTDPETGLKSEQTMSPEWQRIEQRLQLPKNGCVRDPRTGRIICCDSSSGGLLCVEAYPKKSKNVPVSRSVVTASRIFSGPNEYPPTQFAAYGILAFRSRPTQYDRDRHLMFCNAYVAALPHASELRVPPSKQMVTVWPLISDGHADRLNSTVGKSKDICQTVVDDYGLVIAQQALKDAQLTGKTLNGAGPFLLAWSPSVDKGKEDALVLVSDLSDITTYEQARERFLAWSRDIESDPALWVRGWDLERVRTHIRNWVDKYGEMALALFSR